MEHYTTCAYLPQEPGKYKDGMAPIEPPGEGWSIIATSISEGIIYWTWKRETVQAKTIETDTFLTQTQLPLELFEKGIK